MKMPKDTFERLPAEKRQRIIDAAISEFSRRLFRDASLSKAVAEAGISKGSIYQYFTNKLDLYDWLLSTYVERVWAARASCRTPPCETLGDWLCGQARLIIDAVHEAPRLTMLRMLPFTVLAEPETEDLRARLRSDRLREIENELRDYARQDSLSLLVPPKTAAHLVASTLYQGLPASLLDRLDVRVDPLLDEPGGHSMSARSRQQMAEDIGSFLYRGLVSGK